VTDTVQARPPGVAWTGLRSPLSCPPTPCARRQAGPAGRGRADFVGAAPL